MDDELAVAGVDGGHHLRKEPRGLGLVQPAFIHDVRKELSAAHVFGDQVDAVDLLNGLEQVEEVGMLDAVQDGDLVHQPLLRVFVRDLVLLQHLDRHRLARVPLHGQHHLAKRALPHCLEQRVVADRLHPVAGLICHAAAVAASRRSVR